MRILLLASTFPYPVPISSNCAHLSGSNLLRHPAILCLAFLASLFLRLSSSSHFDFPAVVHSANMPKQTKFPFHYCLHKIFINIQSFPYFYICNLMYPTQMEYHSITIHFKCQNLSSISLFQCPCLTSIQSCTKHPCF